MMTRMWRVWSLPFACGILLLVLLGGCVTDAGSDGKATTLPDRTQAMPSVVQGMATVLSAPTARIPTAVATPSPRPTGSAPTSVTPTPRSGVSPASGEVTGRGTLKLPVRVRIPRINVSAEIETVGLAADGQMAAPQSYVRVGWYGLGPVPGEPGASVLAGHVDSVRGPAVFWSLRDLRSGDQIEVELTGGQVQRFVVEGSGWYTPVEAPLATIFAVVGPPRLHLVTCGGTFDHARREYSHRLVVYARLTATQGRGDTGASQVRILPSVP